MWGPAANAWQMLMCIFFFALRRFWRETLKMTETGYCYFSIEAPLVPAIRHRLIEGRFLWGAPVHRH